MAQLQSNAAYPDLEKNYSGVGQVPTRKKVSETVDLWRGPVDLSKTGTYKAAPFLYVLGGADFASASSVGIVIGLYVVTYLHQSFANAATITTNYAGTTLLLTLFGGFIADSYLGQFWTIFLGSIILSLGLGLLTFTAGYHGLQPAFCVATIATGPCPPAGSKYMAPLYVALYTIAFGSALLKPNSAAFGADQFDETNPIEKKESISFFVWYYFSQNAGLLIAFSLAVYLQIYVSPAWGFGFTLMLFGVGAIFFLLGTPYYRHKVPAGSFLTRVAQVLVASIRKRHLAVPSSPSELYDAATIAHSRKLAHTTRLRFLDKAAVMENKEDRANRWRLCSVSQVEETKRILLVLPIWASTAIISLVFAQMLTFTVSQSTSMDRKLSKHFVVPPPSMGLLLIACSLTAVPIYDRILVPLASRYNGQPYGFSPLIRMGASICFAILAMIVSALVERRRLVEVRASNLENFPLGTFSLKMKFWWLVPQYFMSSLVEISLYVAQYQFFFHELSDATRSMGTSFMMSSTSFGYLLSSVLVKIVNHATRNDHGGSWLEGQLNNGGLEKFYYLLAIILAVSLIIFVVLAHRYEYKYDWYGNGDQNEAELSEVPEGEAGKLTDKSGPEIFYTSPLHLQGED